MRILDVGCGTKKVSGAIGIDRVLLPGVDVVADLADPRYPFADDTFDEIHLNDVIEHLPDTIGTMEALFRMARADSRVFIRVVNWNSHYTAMDPTHVKAFTENTFDFFGKHERSYYSRARFDVVKCDKQYNQWLERRVMFGSSTRRRRYLAFLSTYLCNVLEGLNFELRTVKPVSPAAVSDDVPLSSLLRCPHCAALRVRKKGAATGSLTAVGEYWLVCHEDSCQRKYPVFRGVPIMLTKEAEQWTGMRVEDLPVTPPVELEHLLPASA